MDPLVQQSLPPYGLGLLGWLAGLGILVLVAIAASLPYSIFRLAFRNRVRLDGSISQRRARRELKYLADFVGSLVLVPVLVVGAFGGALTIVHSYITPIPLVADVFSVFDANPTVWEERMERGELGDLGAQYEQWSRTRGFSAQSARFWQEFLWRHWPFLGIGAALLGAFGYWFVTGYYVSTVAHYHAGILKRRKRYRERDVASMLIRSR